MRAKSCPAGFVTIWSAVAAEGAPRGAVAVADVGPGDAGEVLPGRVRNDLVGRRGRGGAAERVIDRARVAVVAAEQVAVERLRSGVDRVRGVVVVDGIDAVAHHPDGVGAR